MQNTSLHSIAGYWKQRNRHQRLMRRLYADWMRLSNLHGELLTDFFVALGEQAEDAAGEYIADYLAETQARTRARAQRKVSSTDIVARILAALRTTMTQGWQDVGGTLYGSTMTATVETIAGTLQTGIMLPDAVQARVLELGGTRLGLIDLTEQTKTAVFRSLRESRVLGEHPSVAGRRIRDMVGAGRWTNAGPRYRGYMIARTETKFAQNVSSIEAYEAADIVVAVMAVDAQAGGEQDDECLARDGQLYPFREARRIIDHPNGTLSWSPLTQDDLPSGHPLEREIEDATPPPAVQEITRPQTGKDVRKAIKNYHDYDSEIADIKEQMIANVNSHNAIIKKLNNLSWNVTDDQQRLRQEYRDEIAALARAHKDLQARKKAIDKAKQPQLNDIRERFIYHGNDPTPLDYKTAKTASKVPAIQEGIDAIRKMIVNLDNVKTSIKTGRTGRGYAQNLRRYRGDEYDSVVVNKNTRARTVVHEIGHNVEYGQRTKRHAIIDFLNERTKGKNGKPGGERRRQLKTITGNKSYGNETTTPDEFIDAYMGKRYNKNHLDHENSTEMMSMGLEMMYAEPVRFANRDPEMFDFIYDVIMRGPP